MDRNGDMRKRKQSPVPLSRPLKHFKQDLSDGASTPEDIHMNG